MAESIYNKIGKLKGKDVRLVRNAAHHPFGFFSKVMADDKDHRPVRFRYLGIFATKPYWRKKLRRSTKVGYPQEGDQIYARVPEIKFNRTYTNLKRGEIKDGRFLSFDGNVNCPLSDVQFWVLLSISE